LPASAAEPVPSQTAQLVELSAIAGGLAHEIRNSLSTLRVNLQLLDEDWQGGDSRPDGDSIDAREVSRRSRGRIGTLLKESKRLEGILDDFLQFVNRRELKIQSCELNGLIGELADFYRPQAQVHGIELSIVTRGRPLVCGLDVNLIKQAILNLLINAQQAMGDGGQITIQIGDAGDATARIDVIDNGPGIPAAEQARIFQAYFSTKKRGTGLGLSMARQIVREHGGRIHVHSDPPHGTCFTILLPRA
jgi:signal transduction histidine kinase